jgi:ABC-type uncharacterized transport system substrate-binding protein
MKHPNVIRYILTAGIALLAPCVWSATLEPGADKVLSSFHEVFPSTKSVAIIYSDKASEGYVKKAEAAAKDLKLEFKAVKIESFKDIPPSTRSLFGKIDTLWLVDDAIISQTDALNYLLLNSAQQQWKTIVLQEEWLRRGGLFHLTTEGETVINKRLLELLKLSLPEGRKKIRYYGEKDK